jgi:hypothetical protein
MEKFKDFYATNDDKSLFKKIDVVLFLGDYDPITKDEYSRIKQFISEVVRSPTHISKFSEKVDVGLLINCEKIDAKLETRNNNDLNFEEKNYITTKIFGLKCYPVNLDKLFISSLLETDDSGDTEKYISEITDQLKKYFHKQNILIVLSHTDRNFEEVLFRIKEIVSSDNINIDFLIFNHKPEINELGLPFDGKLIKSVVLLDYEKPNPEDLKAFSAKNGLLDYVDEIRKIHFKSLGNNYSLIFELLFPDLQFYVNEKSDTKESNCKFLMDLLRNMYLKK